MKVSACIITYNQENFIVDCIEGALIQLVKFGAINSVWTLADYNFDNLLQSNMIFCSAMFKKTDWQKVNGYDQNMTFGYEDWEFWIAMLKNGEKVKRIKEIVFFYRIKPNSMLKNMNQQHFDFSNKYITNKHIDFFFKSFNILKINNNRMKGKKFVLHLLFKNFFGIKIFNFD